MATPTNTVEMGSCLGRTCLKWDGDGALSVPDFELVMQRLARVDRHVAVLRESPVMASASDPSP
jgi:hypothetical protein